MGHARGNKNEGAKRRLLLRPVFMTVTKPSTAALLLALVPFVAMCFSVSLWDRVYPMLLGVPFNLIWLIAWIVLSSLCMWGVYQIESARSSKDGTIP
jgi:membrane protein required for beta-lactamase induction